MKNKRGSVPKTKLRSYKKMNVNFDDKVRTLKTLDGTIIRNVRLDTLVIIRASAIAKREVYDIRQALQILEKSGVLISSLFNETLKPLTLKTICIEALDNPGQTNQGEKRQSAEERYKRGDLIGRIYKAKGEIDLDPKEVVLIKDLLAESNYLNTVLHQAYDWLEGKKEK